MAFFGFNIYDLHTHTHTPYEFVLRYVTKLIMNNAKKD